MLRADLKNYDFGLAIDKSTSMGEKEPRSGLSRWDAAKEQTLGLARKMAENDADGIDLFMFAGNVKTHRNVKADQVGTVWSEHEPNGGTNIAPVIREAGETYLRLKREGKAKKGYILGIVTDGQPQDQDEVKQAIISLSKKLDRDEEFGIQFLQIGDDPAATKYLKTLDDDLVSQGAKFDIVDTTTFADSENKSITDLLIGALTD